jgi:uncharacterized cupin superfamily protein
MPRIDLDSIALTNKTGYPAPYSDQVQGRWYRRLAPAGRLTEMGASHVWLDPGAWSSQRHWHEGEDELLIMLSGTAILVEDNGETELKAGDVAAWPKGDPNGHHLINRSTEPCSFIAISAGPGGAGHYSDIDMRCTAEGDYVHKDGTPY